MRIHINSDADGMHVILAAGGVIERQGKGGVEIAVIRRVRYGLEWCLPKGKVKEGESLTDTTQREIREETGCEVELIRFLATDSYQTQNKIKTVYYWLCHLTDGCQFAENEEVKELRWLSPKEAISQLTHASQKKLIHDTYLNQLKEKDTAMKKIGYLYSRYVQAKRWKRLASSITTYREEYPCLLDLLDSKTYEYHAKIGSLLNQAESALMEGDIDKGWKCFLSARRVELLTVKDKAILQAKAEQLRTESEKLNKWRKDAIATLLPAKIQPADLNPLVLFDAALIRDEHYSNLAYKQALRRVYHLFLGILLVLHLSWLYYQLNHGCITFNVKNVTDLRLMFPGVMTFGLLGAIFSAIIKSIDIDISARIPETALAIRVTLLRIVLGAGTAVILDILLTSQVMALLNKEIVDLIKDLEPTTIYAISIAAGFSERLVLHALKKINKE